jgi:membrane protease YdiL (CAAX protease family)
MLLAVASFIGGSLERRKRRQMRPSGRVVLRRLKGRSGARLLFSQLILLVWLTAEYFSGRLTLDSIGVSRQISPLSAFAAGTLICAAFLAFWVWIIRRLGRADEFADLEVQALALVLPRSPNQKVLACIAIVFLNPLTEEAVFRGVLVHHFSYLSGGLGLPIAVGLAANLMNHLYQGLRLQVFHLGIFIVAVAILFSPLGLIGAVGFHFVGDLVPTLTARRDLHRYRARHSRASAARAAA